MITLRLIKGIIHRYASVYHNGSFYIFGGIKVQYNDEKQIARLDELTHQWFVAGSMERGRRGHSVIYQDSVFLVVGGLGNYRTETCAFDGMNMTCTLLDTPLLNDYVFTPALLPIDDNFDVQC